MQIIENNLEAIVETWDDPGDYPSGAGSGPLPSYNYLAGIEGQLTIELEDKDLPDQMTVQEWLDDIDINQDDLDLRHGARVKKWAVDKIEGRRVTLHVAEHDADSFEDPGRRDYYDDY